MSISNMARLSIILTVAHMESLGSRPAELLQNVGVAVHKAQSRLPRLLGDPSSDHHHVLCSTQKLKASSYD